MKKIFSLFAAVLMAGSMMAAIEEIAVATFNGKGGVYTEGWTTTGTGVGRTDCVIIGAGENITSPEMDLSEYSRVYVAFSGRRYGSLSGSKATVNVAVNGTSVGSIDITASSVGVVTDTLMFTPTADMTNATFVFTCSNATSAGSTHGAGIGQISLLYDDEEEEEGEEDSPIGELLCTLDFPSHNDAEISSYEATWTATVDGAAWTLTAFNNNKNVWNLVKCGRKGVASVASITTPAFKDTVNAIVYEFAALPANSVDSAFLYTLNGNNVIAKTPVTLVAGKDSFAIAAAQRKYSYKLEIYCKSASGNGPIQLSSVKVYGFPYVAAVADPVFDVAAGSYYDPQTIHLSCATPDSVFFYTTDGTEPTRNSNIYYPQYGIYLSESATIKAIAFKNDLSDSSDVVTKDYQIAITYNSFDELVNQAGAPANQKVVVNFENVVIDSLYTSKGGKVNGVYLTAAGRMVEIYCYDVPAEWEVGGTISGTVKGEWKEYLGTWEVCPTSWEGITYKAAAGTVTPPADAVIEIYAGTGYSYATYDDEEWEAQVAISGDKMYIKHIFPNMQNTLWVVGTISDGQVVFAGGQAIGEQDQTLMGGEMKFTDCALYAMTADEDLTDATFSWNAVTKTLTALDYEVVSYTAIGGGVNDAFDGTSDPSATFTLVGTGVVPTAVENVKAVKAVKVIENGQVVIIREGVRYNVAGQKL